MLAIDRATAELESTIERIAGFLALPPDWDSYGANPPSPAAVATAQRAVRTVFARHLAAFGAQVVPHWVAPIPDGGVQIDWRGSRGEFEVDVDPSGSLGYLLQEAAGEAANIEEGDDVPLSTVVELLARVFDRSR